MYRTEYIQRFLCKPALNTQLLDMVKADSKIYAQALSEYMQEDFNEVTLLEALRT